MADFFSRHPCELAPASNKAERYINKIINYSTPSALSMDQVVEATLNDKKLQKLSKIISSNMSSASYRLTEDLQEFRHVINETTMCDNGILLRNHQILIPETLHKHVLELAHIGHQGIVKTKDLLRSKVWFPGINRKVEVMIKFCNECQ